MTIYIYIIFTFIYIYRYAPSDDPSMKATHFKRTKEQNDSIGLISDESAEDQALKQGKYP